VHIIARFPNDLISIPSWVHHQVEFVPDEISAETLLQCDAFECAGVKSDEFGPFQLIAVLFHFLTPEVIFGQNAIPLTRYLFIVNLLQKILGIIKFRNLFDPGLVSFENLNFQTSFEPENSFIRLGMVDLVYEISFSDRY
jgi:hypothetical protein